MCNEQRLYHFKHVVLILLNPNYLHVKRQQESKEWLEKACGVMQTFRPDFECDYYCKHTEPLI